MAPPKRFTAQLLLSDGKTIAILVPYSNDGSIPSIIEVGAKTHRKRFKKTGKKTALGEWIYGESTVDSSQSTLKGQRKKP